jgi:hypothetical protein
MVGDKQNLLTIHDYPDILDEAVDNLESELRTFEQAEQWLVSSKSGPFTTELGSSSDLTRTCQR